MHELSLAQNILAIIREHVPGEAGVRSVKLRIGEMSGVVPDSLEFCFAAITQETPLAAVRLEIIPIPYRISCARCGSESRTEPGMAFCPLCGSSETTVVGGTELQVVEIEIDDTA